MSRRPVVPAADAELFRAAVKDARPLKGRVRAKPPPRKIAAAAPAVPAAKAVTGTEAAARPARKPARKPAGALPPLAAAPSTHPDRSTAEKMRRGRLPVEASLDLHGKTLAAAEPALSAFLARAQAQGLRLVLVVTGKGTRVDRETGRIAEGAIRREFPHWLDQHRNRGRIVAYRAAHARHGGGGAFYVLLKRLKRE